MPYKLVGARATYQNGDQALFQREQLEVLMTEMERDGWDFHSFIPSHQDDVNNLLDAQFLFHKPADRRWGS